MPVVQANGDTEVVVFEDCSHAPIYENVEAFNQRTLDFLNRHPG
jgi:pimeloyl-ACP methyl ester carboxylesterase